jgi:AraC-like DNA-binding protein
LSKSIPYTRGFVLLALAPSFVAEGGDLHHAFASVDLPAPEELKPDQVLPATAYYGLLEEMTRQLGDRHFPARVGASIARSGLPALRESRNASHSVCEFLVRLQIVFKKTVSNAVYEVSSDGERAILSLRRIGAADSSTEKVDALNAAAFVTIFRDEFEPDGIAGLTASLPDPFYLPPDIFGGPALMRRKEGGMALSFPSEWLLRPIRKRWRGQAQDIHGEFGAPGRMSTVALLEERIRFRLQLGTVLLAEVAADLGTTPRQLQRFLKANGTSFRQVLLRQRLEASRRLLATTDRPIGAIAMDCGFASPQTFSRAFSSVFGETASKYRAASSGSKNNKGPKRRA